MFSPLDPHILYTTANVLFKSTDGGNSWQTISSDLTRAHPGIPASLGKVAAQDPKADQQRGAIYALAPSFKNAGTLWAGTDDGLIWVTRDGGKNWKDVTPPGLTPWSKVTQISVSHFDDETAYASVSRFRIDDLRPYIYRTHDSGKTWRLISGGLPDNAPVDTVRADAVRKGLLFAGTENAVWVSFDDGDHWQSLQLNLPHTSMRDLWIHDNDLLVATHGRSFWVLDDITPLRQVTESVAQSAATLFRPGPAYRVRRDTNTDTPLPPDEPAGQNPPDGAIVDYWLASPAKGPLTLEILDAQGKLVRRFSSDDKPEPVDQDLNIPAYWVRPPQTLSAQAGTHRFVWDLHTPPPDSTRHDYPIAAIPHDTPRSPLGPRVLPGQYTVQLTVHGHSYTALLTVRMDPRVKTPAAGLAQQFRMETRLASLMTRAALALTQARSVREQLQKVSGQATGPTAESIAAFGKKLAAIPGTRVRVLGPVSQELTLNRVNGDVATLYGSLDHADAVPSAAQVAALAGIEHDFPVVMKRWSDLVATDIPALNRQLRAASLPEVRLESKAEPEPESEDEE